jgi:ribosomal protein S12 methylthiotransferase accessory factor
MRSWGPVDPLRALPAERLLPAARAAAVEAGVTRLAELTRLDRLGLPVWQAVRPMSRALSVHQGKGATDADAQLGALLEAVESHAAEAFQADGPNCRFSELPDAGRAPLLSDYAADRGCPPPADEEHRWVAAENLSGGEAIYLPFDLVSLDFTRAVPSRFDRASNGVATGSSRAEAAAVALQELIERDAVTEWQTRGLLACTASTLAIDTVPFDWLHAWAERLEAEAIGLRFYHVPSLTGTPVFLCELNDLRKDAAPYRAIQGRGCHPVPELALFKALAEALQARTTYIAGAREDLLPSEYLPGDTRLIRIGGGLPLPPGMAGVDWGSIGPGPHGAEAIAATLAAAGYPQIALVELGQNVGICTVRAFVCGLGSHQRRRRPPLA